MKKLFILLALNYLILSCCSNTLIGTHSLNDEAISLVPYIENQTIEWIDNNKNSFTGKVHQVKNEPITYSSECESEQFDRRVAILNINNEVYTIYVSRNRDPKLYDMEIKRNYNDKQNTFTTTIPVDAFTDVNFNGLNFKDVVALRLMKTYYEENESLIFYNKEKGIVCVYFDQENWYELNE